jgi:deoxyribonuclease IV
LANKEGLLFGTAGIPHSSRERTTQSGIERIHELELGCMEVEFVQGVRMSPQSARDVGNVATRRGIKLSAHAPYFINLNAQELEKMAASQERIIQTARITSLFGGESVVFHPAFYLKDEPAKVYATVKKNLEQIVAKLRAEGNRVWVRPEVMGKRSQFGTLEEILQLSAEVDGVAPAFDFAHWHARTGKANSYNEFMAILKKIEGKVGRKALDNMHIHVSGISYGPKGEYKHLDLPESDFKYEELLRALKDYKVGGNMICESPNLEEDAQLLQQTYRKL